MEETSVVVGGRNGTRLRSGRVLNNSDEKNVSSGGFSSAAEAKAALLSSGGQGASKKKSTFTEENERLLLERNPSRVRAMDGVNHGRRQRVGRVPEQRESAKFTRGNVGVFVERFQQER